MRRALLSCDTEYDPVAGSIRTAKAAPSAFPGGTLIPGADLGAAVQLVAVATPCKFVWLASKNTAGVAANLAFCEVGDVAGQNIPVLPDDVVGFVLEVDDASKVYVLFHDAADGLYYRIFK